MHHWNDQSLFGPPRATNPFAGFSPQKKELWILFQTHRTCVISCHFPGLVIFDIRKPVPKYHPETRWLQVPGVKSHRVPHPFSSFYQLHPRIWWIFDTWVRRDVLDFFHFQGGAVELLESEWSLFDEIFRIGTFKCCLVEQLYGKIANKMNQKLHLYILQMLSTSTQLTYRLIFDPSHCDFCYRNQLVWDYFSKVKLSFLWKFPMLIIRCYLKNKDPLDPQNHEEWRF